MRAKDNKPQVGPRWRRVGKSVLRVGLVIAVIGVVAGGWVYHSATAQVNETLMGLGAQMMAYEHASHQDAPRELVVNGQTLHLSSGTTSRTTTEVLDFFEGRCADADGDLALSMQRLLSDHPDVGGEVPNTPTIRRDDGRVGYVACIDVGRSSIDVSELAQRIGRFGATGNVGEIGDARYVFAEQAERSGQVATHFVAMWTEGEFNVDRMFPEGGDAPGNDVDGVSRPPRARRVLQGAERGMPQSMTVYASAESEASLEAFYRRDLARNGWTILPLDMSNRPANAPATLVAEREQRMVTVMFQPDRGGTTAAIFDAP